MKTFVIIGLVLSSLTALAGPQVCYRLVGANAPSVVPKEICVEGASINLERSQIDVYSQSYRKLLSNMNLNYLARHNENGYSFRASKLIHTKSAGMCDETEEVYLRMNGRSDNEGVVYPTILDMSVDVENYLDNCHSQPDITTFSYKLK